jgi:hypothetical protein
VTIWPRLARSILALGMAAVTAVLSAGCSGSAAAPLFVDVQQRGYTGCVPAPGGKGGAPRWDTPFGFATGAYYNQARTPVTIESVSLIDPHNVTLRSVVVYDTDRNQSSLPLNFPWSQFSQNLPKALWAARQHVPGAVLPPGHPLGSSFKFNDLNEYQIGVEIAARSPRGGWTDGIMVRYQNQGRTYTARAYAGWAIAPPPVASLSFCRKQMQAIDKAWESGGRRIRPALARICRRPIRARSERHRRSA